MNPSSGANPLAAAILITWKRNAAYALRLAEDIDPARFVAQPVPGRTLNHPAWVFSHLNLYAAVAVDLASGRAFDDPADHRYGQKSEPLADPSAYPEKAALLEQWRVIHAAGERALEAAAPSLTSAPNPLPRWRAMHPTVGDMLVTLMVKHESGHLGQLSAWRRAMGLSRVPL
jgi:hypothetical protein